jgi:4-hydroxybenzoate polyprenyltransferase
MAVAAQTLEPPLCVDLDGTLVRTDLLLESLLLLVKRNALYVFCLVFWLLRGKAALKAEIAARVVIDAASLPYDREFLAWLESERGSGRKLWLCTAANSRFAQAIAQHLGIFDGVIASDSRLNLAGVHKAAQLVERFGQGGFDYCGNEWRDLEIWRCSRAAIVVNGGRALERRVASQGAVLRTFPRRDRWGAIVRVIRPHQWAKNILVLVPLLAAHRVGDLAALSAALLGVIAFCLCASSVYVLNDMLDAEADRAHPRKSRRPFAAGDLPLAGGFVLFPLLLVAAACIAAFLPRAFQFALAAYYALTAGYSLFLKRLLIVDALALAGLYTMRIVAGAVVVSVRLSFWLQLFAIFLFLSLAFVKRYAELDALRRQRRLQAVGRGYHVEDLPVLQNLGTAAGYLSVLVLALYINSPDIAGLYHRPRAIWMLCVLMLYWISRVWMKAHRGAMHDDPLIFALRDRVSLGLGLLAAITVFVAI